MLINVYGEIKQIPDRNDDLPLKTALIAIPTKPIPGFYQREFEVDFRSFVNPPDQKIKFHIIDGTTQPDEYSLGYKLSPAEFILHSIDRFKLSDVEILIEGQIALYTEWVRLTENHKDWNYEYIIVPALIKVSAKASA